jgi:hypothetical protein
MNREILNRLLARGIKPHRSQIVKMGSAGDVAVVMFDPSEGGIEVAKKLGRQGDEPVFAVNVQAACRAMTDADAMTQKWFSSAPSRGVIKIYVLVNDEHLLVNFKPGHGFSLEPGSMPQEVWN